jgi:hypothetical protein
MTEPSADAAPASSGASSADTARSPARQADPGWVVAPRPEATLTLNLTSMINSERLSPEVLGMLSALLADRTHDDLDNVTDVCVLSPCGPLSSCSSYDAHGHGCYHLASCGVFSPLAEEKENTR